MTIKKSSQPEKNKERLHLARLCRSGCIKTDSHNLSTNLQSYTLYSFIYNKLSSMDWEIKHLNHVINAERISFHPKWLESPNSTTT